MNTNIFLQNGFFQMLALDHRDSFLKSIKNGKDPIELKEKIISSLRNQFSGLLIDRDFGFPAYQKVDIKKPFIMPLEESGFREQDNVRLSSIKDSPKKIKEVGSKGTKILVYFDLDTGSPSISSNDIKNQIILSHQVDLPFFLEIVTYNQNTNQPINEALSYFLDNQIIPDVFKLEYPGSSNSCTQITKQLNNVPWILLTRGALFNDFEEQLKISIDHGCQGFLAGRALWQELLTITEEKEFNKFLEETLPKRFEKICHV